MEVYTKSDANASDAVLNAALDYLRRGWHPIPIGRKNDGGLKQPLVKWKTAPPPTEEQLIEQFKRQGVTGVGILTGNRSGGLIVIDFDDSIGYAAWCDRHPELSKIAPTARTGRNGGGFHVYLMCPGFGRKRESRHADCDLVLADGGYVAAAPSMHQSGRRYEWVVPLGDAVPLVKREDLADLNVGPSLSLPVLDIEIPSRVGVSGVSENTGVSVSSMSTSNTMTSMSNTDPINPEDYHGIIQQCAVVMAGTRDTKCLTLARALDARPELHGRPAKDLKGVVRIWHNEAAKSKLIKETTEFDDSYAGFCRIWGKVRSPLGSRTLVTQALEAAEQSDPPPEADAYDDPKTKLLISFCREMKRLSWNQQPFHLSCRLAAELIGWDNQQTAANRLNMLVTDGVLVRVTAGEQKKGGKASTYQYPKEVKPATGGDAHAASAAA